MSVHTPKPSGVPAFWQVGESSGGGRTCGQSGGSVEVLASDAIAHPVCWAKLIVAEAMSSTSLFAVTATYASQDGVTNDTGATRRSR